MTHCDGRQFDGSACNTDLIDCDDCGASGCTGDGCDNQRYVAGACECGATVAIASAPAPELATSAA